jgi:hypothetical protein
MFICCDCTCTTSCPDGVVARRGAGVAGAGTSLPATGAADVRVVARGASGGKGGMGAVAATGAGAATATGTVTDAVAGAAAGAASAARVAVAATGGAALPESACTSA